jgi:UDP-glucose 4-epimerase
VNVIDNDLPTRARFLKVHRSLTGWPKVVLPLPWRLWLGSAKCLSPVHNRLPGLLREPTLRARLMPLRYPNVALRQALGGQDIAPFEEMLARSVKGQRP